MVLTEFNQEIYEESIRLEGIQEGEQNKLLQQIEKKLAKGKSLEQIADELEESVEIVRPLYIQILNNN